MEIKGIDDALSAGAEIQCLNGVEAESKIEKLSELSGIKNSEAEGEIGRSSKNLSPPHRVVRFSEVVPEDIQWLWFPYIPLGKVTLLEGDPSLGKSWITLALAAAVSIGEGLPECPSTEPGTTLFFSAEDGIADTLKPRLMKLGGDHSRILAFEGLVTFDEEGSEAIRRVIEEHKPKLVIIDPLVAYLGGGIDINRSNETREIMTRISKIAEAYKCAILCVRHLTKESKTKAAYRGIGSIDFTAAARSVLLVGCDPKDKDNRAIIQTKSNLAKIGDAIGYEVRDGSLYWTGKSDLDAVTVLGAETAATKNQNDEDSRLKEAESFLREILAQGPIESQQVFDSGESKGIVKRTLYRAKETLEIRATKEKGKDGKWLWHPPIGCQPSKDSQAPRPPEVGQVDQLPKNDTRGQALAHSAPSQGGLFDEGEV